MDTDIDAGQEPPRWIDGHSEANDFHAIRSRFLTAVHRADMWHIAHVAGDKYAEIYDPALNLWDDVQVLEEDVQVNEEDPTATDGRPRYLRRVDVGTRTVEELFDLLTEWLQANSTPVSSLDFTARPDDNDFQIVAKDGHFLLLVAKDGKFHLYDKEKKG